jgi:hypothetical protein
MDGTIHQSPYPIFNFPLHFHVLFPAALFRVQIQTHNIVETHLLPHSPYHPHISLCWHFPFGSLSKSTSLPHFLHSSKMRHSPPFGPFVLLFSLSPHSTPDQYHHHQHHHFRCREDVISDYAGAPWMGEPRGEVPTMWETQTAMCLLLR